MRSLASRVTTQRRVRLLAAAMGKRITAAMLAAAGGPGSDIGSGGKYRVWRLDVGSTVDEIPGGWEWEMGERTALGERPWYAQEEPAGMDGLVALGSEPSIQTVSASDPQGTHRLVKLDVAAEYLRKHAFKYMARYETRLRVVGTYRAWMLRKRAEKIVGRELARAIGALSKSAYRQSRKRKGAQKVSTRSAKWRQNRWMVDTFNGTWAFRRPTGRPALSEHEWLRRYRERLKRRRKTNRRRRDWRKLKVPSTRHPRPSRYVETVVKQLTETSPPPNSTGPFGPTDNDADLVEALREKLLDAGDSLGNDFGADLSDAVKRWAESVFD